MTDSLRDQLLGLGFKPPAAVEPRTAPRGPDRGRPQSTDSLRPATPPARGGHADKNQRKPRAAPPARPRPYAGQGGTRTREDIDLAKAYAIRAQREKDERIQAEQSRQEEARRRREAKVQLSELLKDKTLNNPAAEIARHFEYGGKIKRIHVDAGQLRALNAGELGVVQLDGRYVLIDAALLAQVETIFAPAIALKVDPAATASDDPYADPQYKVPDDLVW